MEPAIQVDRLSKRYFIERTPKQETLREKLASILTRPVRDERHGGRREFWALRDVSFELQPGEVLGVIGRNGAGKSTLLKILSRITEPTGGRAVARGRTASLLEVGTGFHQDLSGRENIFLSGSLLGMHRSEIQHHFDEIVRFADVEKFIDTPVKRYSSGMFVRLAFAVAAHLNSDILFLDEVLAVGDVAFQRKCLAKVGEVAHEGRTVLFVSHNLRAITGFCNRVLWLDEGQVRLDAKPDEAVRAYLALNEPGRPGWTRPSEAPVAEAIALTSARVLSRALPVASVPVSQPFEIEIEYSVSSTVEHAAIVVAVIGEDGTPVLTSWDTDSEAGAGHSRLPGRYRTACRFPGHFLRPGRYAVTVAAHIYRVRVLDLQERAVTFDVSAAGYRFNDERQGIVVPVLEWTPGRSA